MIVVAIVGILAAVAIPGLIRARVSALESAAIGSLRTVNSAQSTYASSCGRGGYAQTIADLQKPAPSSGLLFLSPDVPANGVIKSIVFGFAVTAVALFQGWVSRPTPEGVARRRNVVLLRNVRDRAVVRGEIAANERIIVDGAQRVTEGARAAERNPAPAPQPPDAPATRWPR